MKFKEAFTLLGAAAILGGGFTIYLEWLLSQPRPEAPQAEVAKPVPHKSAARNEHRKK